MGKLDAITRAIVRITFYTIGIGTIDADPERWWVDLTLTVIGVWAISIASALAFRHEAN